MSVAWVFCIAYFLIAQMLSHSNSTQVAGFSLVVCRQQISSEVLFNNINNNNLYRNNSHFVYRCTSYNNYIYIYILLHYIDLCPICILEGQDELFIDLCPSAHRTDTTKTNYDFFSNLYRGRIRRTQH